MRHVSWLWIPGPALTGRPGMTTVPWTIYSSHKTEQSMRSPPPFRADHVGSLLRPPELLRARADHAAGRTTREQLWAIEDKAVTQVIRMQEDIGLQGVTDGEF